MGGSRALRLLFFGTPEFAVPSLRSLASSRHRVVGVVSQPDRPRGRGRRLEATPVKREAEGLGLEILQPEKVGAAAERAWMRERGAELGCVVAFGQFIPRGVRELPSQGLINAHASLLPRHRGAAPVAHAILAGDRLTGITVIRVEREMDAGDWCLKRSTPIEARETAGELAARLAELAATSLLEAVDAIAAGTVEFRAQDAEEVTLAPKVGRELGRIDWREPRDAILRRVRAATPWPGADLALRHAGVHLRILEAGPGPTTPPAAPGRVQAGGGALRVRALDGWIEVLRLQKPGGRPLTAAEYLRGASVPDEEEAESP